MIRKVTHNKLVRDRIPEIIRVNGDRAKVRKLTIAQFRKALLTKLVEETNEVAKAKGKKALIAELADVQEVLMALYQTYGVQCEDVTKTARKKRKERGGFSKRLFLESTTTS